MRKFYLIILALFVANTFAQQSDRDYSDVPHKHKLTMSADKGINSFYINEDFNGTTFPPVNWTLQSPDGGSGWTTIDVGTAPLPGWNGGEATDHTGATTGKMAYCTWNTGGSSANDQWLITPQVTIANGDILNFWIQRAYTYADAVDILLSTTGNSTTDFTETIDNLTWNGSASVDWIEKNYDLSAYNGQQVYIAFREHVADNQGDGAAILLDDVRIGSPEPWDAALTQLTINPYVTLGNVDITGDIKNNGANTITDIDLTWSDGTNQYTDNLTGLSIVAGATYSFTHTTQLNVANAQAYNIKAWVTLVDDAFHGNDTATTVIAGVTEIPVKKVVGEEAGGTWCGWCVRGIVALKDLAHYHPDDWIGIAVHNQDPMTVAAYDGSMNVGGYPSGYVDRAGETDPSTFADVYAERVQMVAPVKIEVVNTAWDPNTNTISYDVKATFVTQLSGDYRLNAVITEDNVSGTSSGWEQHNYYSSSSQNIDLIDWEGINYKNLSDPIPAANMVYNEVARAILGGFNGTSGSVPSAVNAGDVATYSYNYVVPADQKAQDMHLIGFIIDNNSGEILNGDMVESPYFVNVENINENSSINIFPNPSTGIVNVKGAENSTIEVLNSIGQVVLTVNNASNMESVNLSAYNEGTYIVRVITNNNITVKKINIVK